MKTLVVLALAAVAVPATVVLTGGGREVAAESVERLPSPSAAAPSGGGELRSRARLSTERLAAVGGAFTPRAEVAPRAVMRASIFEQLVEDLRDDGVRGNATSAVSELVRRAREDALRRGEIRAALEPHAASADDQLRVIACSLLIQIDLLEIEAGRRTEASAALLDQASAWLATRPRLETYFYGALSYHRTVLFAMEHIDEIEGRLVDAVLRPAGRDVFSHAFVLGATGRTRQTGLVAPLLIEHLLDNHRDDDACMATEALIGLGRAALPWFEAELESGDAQQRLALEAIIQEVTDPTLTLEQARAREITPKLSYKYLVPARSWRFRTSYKRHSESGEF